MKKCLFRLFIQGGKVSTSFPETPCIYVLYVINVCQKMSVFGLANPLLSLFYNYVFFSKAWAKKLKS